MRLIHAAGFSASEKEAYRTVVFENVLTSMQAMLEAMDILRIEMNVQKNLVSASSFDWQPSPPTQFELLFLTLVRLSIGIHTSVTGCPGH